MTILLLVLATVRLVVVPPLLARPVQHHVPVLEPRPRPPRHHQPPVRGLHQAGGLAGGRAGQSHDPPVLGREDKDS